MKNKITTQGYFIKRLKDSGYEVWKMFDAYSEADPRKFTILVDPKHSSLWITCYENLIEAGDVWFEFHDGGQFFPSKYKVNTDSFEVIANLLTERGIVNKYEQNK